MSWNFFTKTCQKWPFLGGHQRVKALFLLLNQMQEHNENQRTHGSSEPSAEHAVCCAEVASQFANEVAQKSSKKADVKTEKLLILETSPNLWSMQPKQKQPNLQ